MEQDGSGNTIAVIITLLIFFIPLDNLISYIWYINEWTQLSNQNFLAKSHVFSWHFNIFCNNWINYMALFIVGSLLLDVRKVDLHNQASCGKRIRILEFSRMYCISAFSCIFSNWSAKNPASMYSDLAKKWWLRKAQNTNTINKFFMFL